ncbi:MAG: hypothetical protein R6X02_23665 [Enhygromyxa sp.]
MAKDPTWRRSAACGLIGGAVGVSAMNASMKLSGKLLRIEAKPPRRKLRKGESPSWSQIGEHHEGDEPATAALGRVVYEGLTGQRPSEETKQRLSTALHWGYGLTVGALYGLIRGRKRWLITDAVGGLSYGVGLWVFGDMLAVPLLGLADKPTRYRLRVHAHALSGHLVYGLATAAATRVANKVWD